MTNCAGGARIPRVSARARRTSQTRRRGQMQGLVDTYTRSRAERKRRECGSFTNVCCTNDLPLSRQSTPTTNTKSPGVNGPYQDDSLRHSPGMASKRAPVRSGTSRLRTLDKTIKQGIRGSEYDRIAKPWLEEPITKPVKASCTTGDAQQSAPQKSSSCS